MIQFQTRASLALAVLAVFATSCDDDNPTAADAPCNDPNTTCVSLTLTGADAVYSSIYDNLVDRTTHSLRWDIVSHDLSGYGPNQRVRATVILSPPIRVRYDHPDEFLYFGGGTYTGCTDRYATAAATFTNNRWTSTTQQVAFAGECTNGASILEMTAGFTPLVVGEELSSVTFDFTVPETYASGVGAGESVLSGDVPLLYFALNTTLVGDNEGDPPIWPGDEPALPSRGRPASRSAERKVSGVK